VTGFQKAVQDPATIIPAAIRALEQGETDGRALKAWSLTRMGIPTHRPMVSRFAKV